MYSVYTIIHTFISADRVFDPLVCMCVYIHTHILMGQNTHTHMHKHV